MVSHIHHEHPLTLVTDTVSLYPDYNGDWQCDNCNQSFDNRHHPYHCNLCSFDICGKNCFHPKKHILHPSHNLFYSDMTKIYRMHGGKWKCDGCGELKEPANERFAYHCYNDEFDICKSCCDGRDFPIHIHKLKPADTSVIYDDAPGYWVCDSCKRTGSEIGTCVSWHCSVCEFDACKRCLKEIYIPQHPQHPLKITDPRRIYPQDFGAWRCDSCGNTCYSTLDGGKISNKPYHCFLCNFNACSTCVPIVESPGMDIPVPIYPTKDTAQPFPLDDIEDDDNSAENLDDSQKCIVCINKPKNATIVHGNTGHVCCCLSCAFTLQRRGDSCPICRAPIDRVIKHYTS